MKNLVKKKSILIMVLILSLLVALVTVYNRVQVEKRNKGIEITLDYKEVKSLSRQSDEELSWWLKKFKDLGAYSVAIEEESLESMVKDDKDLEVRLLNYIQKDIEWENRFDPEFVKYVNDSKSDKYDVVAITKDNKIYDFIIEGLEKRYPESFYNGIKGEENFYIILDGTEEEALYTEAQKIVNYEGKPVSEEITLYSSKVAKIGLGFDPDKIKIVKESGLKVLPRPINYQRYPKKLIEAFKDEIDKYDINPSILIFSGKEILGYEGYEDELIKYMNENHIATGMVETSVQREHLEQKGLEDLVEALDYNSVRVFSVWPYIQERFKYYNYEGAEEIENTLYRAVTERNIRVIYFKPFKEEEFKYVTDYVEYEKMFNSFIDRIERHGMSLGQATTMDSNSVGILQLSFVGFGVVAAGLLLLNIFIEIRSFFTYILLALGLLFIVALNLFWTSMSDKLIALGASIVFPTLSIAYLLNYCKEVLSKSQERTNVVSIIKGSLATLFVCVVISLLGGLFVGAALSDIRYLLEMDIFRGVKASQITPIALFSVLYIFKFGYGRSKEEYINTNIDVRNKSDFVRLLEQDVRVKHVFFISLLLIAGYIYIARTGHETTIQPTDIEMIIRNFMENALLARPRTKELFIGFPGLMLAVYMAYKGYKKLIFPLSLAAIIGLASAVNTFSHLRTPIYLSVIRTFYGMFFGALLGIMGILFFWGLERVVKSLGRRHN